MVTTNDNTNHETRFWIDDNIEYTISIDGKATNYCGLVDENKGGIIVWGAYEHLLSIVQMLNKVESQNNHQPQPLRVDRTTT